MEYQINGFVPTNPDGFYKQVSYDATGESQVRRIVTRLESENGRSITVQQVADVTAQFVTNGVDLE